LQAWYGQVRSADVLVRAREASEQALRHGPDLAEAHAARGLYEMVFEWNWKGAEEHFTRSYALDPWYMQGSAWYAVFFLGCFCGEWPASLAMMEPLVARDPLSAYAQGMYSAALGFGTGTPAGLAPSHRAGELDPDAFLTWFAGQCARCGTDDAVGMRRTSEMAWSLSGRLMFSLVIYGLWCAQHGEREKARLVLDELDARAPHEPELHFSRGVIALMLGDRARAEPLMQQAIAERDPQVWMWGPVWPAFPMFRELADDPAYRAVREASGIASFLRERAARAGGAPVAPFGSE
jgi:tetratricopeptide (TPR) repeat protein